MTLWSRIKDAFRAPRMEPEPKSVLYEQTELNTHEEGVPMAYLAGARVYVGRDIIEEDVKSTQTWGSFWTEPKNAAASEAIDRYEKRSTEALQRLDSLLAEEDNEEATEEPNEVVYGVGQATDLDQSEEWVEKHPKFHSMSEAAHKALCMERVDREKHPVGFKVPPKGK